MIWSTFFHILVDIFLLVWALLSERLGYIFNEEKRPPSACLTVGVGSKAIWVMPKQGCIFCLTCSHPVLTEDHVLTSAYVKFFRIVTRNAVNKSFWREKNCSRPPLNKYAMNICLSSLRIRAHLSWRTGKHLHVLHMLRTYSTCSYPGYQDTTTYAAL